MLSRVTETVERGEQLLEGDKEAAGRGEAGETLPDGEAIVPLQNTRFYHSGDLLEVTESAPVLDHIPLQSLPFTEAKRPSGVRPVDWMLKSQPVQGSREVF